MALFEQPNPEGYPNGPTYRIEIAEEEIERFSQLQLRRAIAEVGREIGIRRNVYPRWVAGGRMTQSESDVQQDDLRAAAGLLRGLARIFEAHLSQDPDLILLAVEGVFDPEDRSGQLRL